MNTRRAMPANDCLKTLLWIGFAVLIAIGAIGGIGIARSVDGLAQPTVKPYLATIKLVDQGKVVCKWKAAERLRDCGETWDGRILWRWYQPDGAQVEVLVGRDATLIVEPSR